MIGRSEWNVDELGRSPTYGLYDPGGIFGNRPVTMPMIEVEDEEDYDKAITVEGDKLVVVEWGASWCKNCKRIEPAVSGTLILIKW